MPKTEFIDRDDAWYSNAPPGPAPWQLLKENEHPCVMCKKRVPIANLGRCRPCDRKMEEHK